MHHLAFSLLSWLFVAAAAEEAPDRAFLGVETEPIRPGQDQSGARIAYVLPWSAALEIGLEPGDEIIALNDVIIENPDHFSRELRRENVGARLRFLVRRDGEKVKLTGKIGSHRKTLAKIESSVRERLYGKPFPELPEVYWWNPQGSDWEKKDGKESLARLEGKLSVIFAFDDCPVCTSKRYQRFVQLARIYALQLPAAPLAFAGLYQSDVQDAKGHEETRKHARALFEKTPPSFPVGVVHFSPPESREARENLRFIPFHGLAVIDREGKTRYLQLSGPPEEEFALAYKELLEELTAKDSGESSREPSSSESR